MTRRSIVLRIPLDWLLQVIQLGMRPEGVRLSPDTSDLYAHKYADNVLEMLGEGAVAHNAWYEPEYHELRLRIANPRGKCEVRRDEPDLRFPVPKILNEGDENVLA